MAWYTKNADGTWTRSETDPSPGFSSVDVTPKTPPATIADKWAGDDWFSALRPSTAQYLSDLGLGMDWFSARRDEGWNPYDFNEFQRQSYRSGWTPDAVSGLMGNDAGQAAWQAWKETGLGSPTSGYLANSVSSNPNIPLPDRGLGPVRSTLSPHVNTRNPWDRNSAGDITLVGSGGALSPRMVRQAYPLRLWGSL